MLPPCAHNLSREPRASLAVGGILLLCATLFAAPGSTLAAPPTQVAYTVSVADIPRKTFRVTAKAEGVSEPQVSFALPAWSPGWYVLTNAYKNISNVSAQSETGKKLSVSHPDKHTWTVTTEGAKTVTLSYDLLAKDQDPDVVGPGGKPLKDYGFFAPYLDETNGFVPGPAALMYVVDGKEVPHRVTYNAPSGWKVASANDPTGEPNTFSAPNYDFLADQPADLGKFDLYQKTIAQVPFSVIMVGAGDASHKKFVEACWKIAEAGIKVFGNKPPFPRYNFHFHFVENSPAMMGLEHLNSTIINLPPEILEEPDRTALAIVAHEFVHAWNVKRIRSETLGPFDYTREVRTRDLWWLEGVTDYYAPRLLVEAGLVSADFWRGYMAEQIRDLQGNDARKSVTLETASLKAWEGRSEGFGGLSYYNKGLVVGLLLDIEMRRQTDNKVGLDDLINALYQQSEQTGKGFPEGEIERLAAKLTGTDLKPFFDRALRSTEELDLKGILPAAGLQVSVFTFVRPDFGLDLDTLEPDGDDIRIGELLPDGPAQKAKLRKGDVIETINGKPVRKALASVFQSRQPGDQIEIGYRRNGKREKTMLTLSRVEETLYDLEPTEEMNEQQRAILAAISGARSGRVAAR